MKSKSKWLWLIAIIAIGLVVFACDNGNNNTTTDPCANGHNFPEWTAPTCTTEGNSVRTCTRSGCTATDTRTTGFAAPGHDWLYDPGAKLPTCTETGLGHRHCQRAGCNADEPGTTPYPALGHSWSNWAITTPPKFTAETDGEETRTCSTCSIPETRVYKFYKIGNTGPAGGKIFYVATDGITIQGYTGATGSFAEYTAYYLEAAPANETASRWQSSTAANNSLIDGITTWANATERDAGLAASIGVGRKDTQTIVNSAAFASLTDTAAQRCANKSLNGFTDWFLPSLGELNEFYKLKGQAGVPQTGFFWSSSQYSNNLAWGQHFLDGGQYYNYGDGKNYASGNVRAVRAF